MLNLDELYSRKISEKLNNQINNAFNLFIKRNPLVGKITAFFVIFAKCVLHTIGILANSLEYCFRGFFSMIFTNGSFKEYVSTLGSFLVINTINAISFIPDVFIRSYYAIKDSKIDRSHTQHTFYYKIMRLI